MSKKSFSNSEGASWLSQKKTDAYQYNRDARSTQTIAELLQLEPETTVLANGAGEGGQGALLKKIYEFDCGDIEWGHRLVEHIKSLGVNIFRGTADEVRFSDGLFNIALSVFICICATGQIYYVLLLKWAAFCGELARCLF